MKEQTSRVVVGGGGGSKGGKKSLSRTQDVLKVSLLNFDLIVKIPI